MNILAIDVGGSHVKFRLKDQAQATKFTSGPTMTAEQMANQVIAATKDWQYDGVSIGYPGPVLKDKPAAEPANLGEGWTTFDFAAAFHRPVKIINDAAMQALGSYEGGTMLFLGFGTGLGSAMVCEGKVLPMELAHLPFRKHTFETYVGANGLERLGRKKWRIRVLEALEALRAALLPDYVVLGGGNARNIETPPPYCRLGSNKNAFLGGFRLWDNTLESRL
jgi:polyphosphate glucokinase